MTRKMKDSGIEWIGEIPEDWELLRAKNYFVQSFSKGNNELILLSATQNNGVIPKDMLEGVVQVKEDTDLSTFKTVHPGDYVISLRSFQGGFEMSDYEGVITPAYTVFRNKKPISNLYFKMLFKCDGFITKMNSLTVGIRDGKNIMFSDFANTLIPIPNIDEQAKIANFLTSKIKLIDQTIEKQKQLIEKLKEYKISIITEAVTKGLNLNVPMKESGIEWIGEIPLNWNRCKVLYCLVMPITDGPHETPELFEEGIPFISAEAIKNGKIDFNLKRGYISKNYYDECCKKYIPQRDDIFMIKSGATTGNVALVETDELFTIWSPLAVFRSNNKILPRYLYYYLQSDGFQKQVQSKWSYGTQQNIGMRVLETLIISFGSINEQNEIVEYLDKKCWNIQLKINKKEQLIEKLESYKKSLIYECVTGKREVQ